MAESFTPGQNISKFDTGDNPGAIKLNANWDKIDTRLLGIGSGFPATYPVTALFYRRDTRKIYENTGTVGSPVYTEVTPVSALADDAAHGNRGGGALHALVTALQNGFMSAADFTKLGGIEAGAQVVTFLRVNAALALADAIIDINGQLLTNLAAPTAPTDAANKAYVDSVAQGLSIKDPVRVATTGPIVLSGIQTIDGVLLVANDRVLVKDQAAGQDNGIYLVQAGAWTRSLDADTSPEVVSGIFVFVTDGTLNENSGWVLTTLDPITLGVTVLVFAQFSGAGQIEAGDGLTKTGNTLDVNVDDATIEIVGDDLRVKALGITDAHVAAANKDGSAATPGMRTLGAGASQAASGADLRFPTAAEKAALAGTNGAPGAGNRYVTDSDPRNTNARTPTSHSHAPADITPQGVASGLNADLVDGIHGTDLIKRDGTVDFTGPQSMGGFKLTNLDTPTAAMDAVTKAYVDALAVQGADVKKSCRAATTANIALAGLLTIDGVILVALNRVLVKDQSTPSENGIYVAAVGAWVRAADAIGAEVTAGLFTFIEEGTVNADSGWILVTNDPITVGVTPLVFTQFTGAGQITAGGGLSKSGNTLDVVPHADGSIQIAADSVQVGILATDAQHGSRGGGTQHAVATISVAGFMSAADKVKIDGVASASVESMRFVGDGVVALATNLDGAWIAPRACTIKRITLFRRTAGSALSTIVDVNKNGTTVFTTQANRPTIAFGDGANAISAHTDMDVTALAQNDRIEVDVDAKETGSPKDITVIIEVQY
jgi:phage-related tail fiber protein